MPNRILVLGCSGAGKSTLSRRLGRIHGLPVIHLDAHFWRPGWVEPPLDEWRAVCADLAAGDRWVLDGNYGSSLDLRLPRAELIVFPDLNRWVCLWRAISRYVKNRGRVREDIAPGCPERIDRQHLRYIWDYPRQHRGRMLGHVARHAPDTPFIRLTSPRAVQSFLTSSANSRSARLGSP